MKRNIKLALYLLKPSDLLTFHRNVITKMKANIHFATPPVSIAEMETAGQELEDLIKAAMNGSLQSRLLRDIKVEEVKGILRRQAAYVRLEANGHVAVLESSGFPLTKVPVTVGIPAVTGYVEARPTGRRGELELRFPKVHGASGYQLFMSDRDPAEAANWVPIGYTTRVKHLVSGLESYKAFYFCVSSIGAAGESAQSDPALGRAA